jgi:hypothetical protein
MSLEKYMKMQLNQVENKNKEMEARFARTKNIDLRNQWKQAAVAKNYQTEYDRIRNYIATNRATAPFGTLDTLHARRLALQRLGASAVDGIRS